MRTHVLRLASLLACVSLSGCDILPMGCDLVGEPIMVIEVRDAVTGQPAAEGATGRITEGDFTSSLRPTGPERMQPEAIERAGTYQVLIRRRATRTGSAPSACATAGATSARSGWRRS